jgi:hypothetical protein
MPDASASRHPSVAPIERTEAVDNTERECVRCQSALERIADALERLAPQRGPFVLEQPTYEQR